MPESDSFWNFFWETHLQDYPNLGKKAAVLAAARLIRELSAQPDQPVRLLELGCGEGQIIGTLVEAHPQVKGIDQSLGVDYAEHAIAVCRRRYPSMHFRVGDFTLPGVLASLGKFELVLMVNALHEVFSAGFSRALGEVDVPEAKRSVMRALAGAVECLAEGGYLVLFDGLEMEGSPQRQVRLRFRSRQARQHFVSFANEYHPFHISYREVGGPLHIELTQRDFTRYITKSIFLGKALWKTERLESYQYFNREEFQAAISHLGLQIRELRTLTMDEEKWRRQVEIESEGIGFPEEHILIVARKAHRGG